MKVRGLPEPQGLYTPENEHDNCGVGFLANIKNRKSHDIIRQGLEILVNLDHRGAVGADELAGDGAGILLQVPDRLFREDCSREGLDLPPLGEYGVGMVFLPQIQETSDLCIAAVEKFTLTEGQICLGWRDVPVDSSFLGESVKPDEPRIRQFFIGRGPNTKDQDAFERKLFVIRKQCHREIWNSGADKADDFYMTSMSSRTIVYKGMLTTTQLSEFFTDLTDDRVESALALVHSRFSTNTFPIFFNFFISFFSH